MKSQVATFLVLLEPLESRAYLSVSGAQQNTVRPAVRLAHHTETLSMARFGISAATARDFAVLAGGGVWGQVNTVDLYDSTTGQWSASAAPHASISDRVSIGSRVLFFAGSAVDIYDGNSRTWSSVAIAEGRGDAAVCGSVGVAMFAGGTKAGGDLSRAVHIYNDANRAWSTASLSVARTRVTAAAAGSKFSIRINTRISSVISAV